MNKIDKIRERINNKETEVKPKKNKILSFANFLLVLSFISVSALTYCKIDEEYLGMFLTKGAILCTAFAVIPN